jgi:hypothetical protein
MKWPLTTSTWCAKLILRGVVDGSDLNYERIAQGSGMVSFLPLCCFSQFEGTHPTLCTSVLEFLSIPMKNSSSDVISACRRVRRFGDGENGENSGAVTQKVD